MLRRTTEKEKMLIQLILALQLIVQSSPPKEPNLTPVVELVQKRAWMYQNPLSSSEAQDIAKAAVDVTQYGISIGLVLALIEFESKYERKAKSKKKCKGLLQLAPGTAKVAAVRIGLHRFDVYDVYHNIEIGVSYLVDLFRENSNMLIALTIYNRGYRKYKEGGSNVSSYARAVVKRSLYLDKVLSKNKEYCQ